MRERKRRRLKIMSVEHKLETRLDQHSDHAGAGVSVGGVLRAERMRLGRSIADVAIDLKIRRGLLEAIETARFDRLPGGTYAVGFVRTYAEYLGLDRDEIVRRFKEEAAGINNRAELVFPQPLNESRLPGGVVLALSLAIAVSAYGLWYFGSQSNRSEVSRVAAVPERLAVLVEKPVTASSSQAEAAPVGMAAPVKPPVGPTPSPSVSAPAAPPPAATTERPARAASAPPAENASAPIESASRAPAANREVAALPPTAETEAVPGQIPSPPAEMADGPKVYGEAGGDVRIVIKATGDSWVQIRDREGNVVFVRILRTGDVYHVPNRPGLRLYTGSAGALDIRVDGKPTPSIGRSGIVRRDVFLDPAKLLAGTA
ncbi:MAG: helix-turn-helix domain-containing protein, partial [Rhodospirillales bacterium]|nr:helix-turn-helix domain-containing protein [Rhodospirillales bacterium]